VTPALAHYMEKRFNAARLSVCQHFIARWLLSRVDALLEIRTTYPAMAKAARCTRNTARRSVEILARRGLLTVGDWARGRSGGNLLRFIVPEQDRAELGLASAGGLAP